MERRTLLMSTQFCMKQALSRFKQVVFCCLLALPLLPVADIDPAFKDVKALVQDHSPSRTLLVQLCRYVERQWINKSTIGAARMSVHDNPTRTNNAVESFHVHYFQTHRLVIRLVITVLNAKKLISGWHSIKIPFAHLISKQLSILDGPAFSAPAFRSRIFRSRIFSLPHNKLFYISVKHAFMVNIVCYGNGTSCSSTIFHGQFCIVHSNKILIYNIAVALKLNFRPMNIHNITTQAYTAAVRNK